MRGLLYTHAKKKKLNHFSKRASCVTEKKIYSKFREHQKMENQEIKPIEIGKKRTTDPADHDCEESEITSPKRTKRDSIVKSENEEDSKSVTSEQSKKSSNVSESTPEPGSTPDEDASDLSDPQIGPNRENVTLFWFTEAALRMTDNPGLKAALQHCKAVTIHFLFYFSERLLKFSVLDNCYIRLR